MDEKITLRKNPSREICEDIVRRILATEVLAKGRNDSFRQASDFMSYFESLYPASDSLTKQVQRAVKALHMPRDENGFFIPNKTAEQFAREKELKSIFQRTAAKMDFMENCEPLFLEISPEFTDYLIYTLTSCDSFRDKFVTIVKTYNGIIIYTNNFKKLHDLLDNFM